MTLDEHWEARGSDAPWLVISDAEAQVATLLLPILAEAGLAVVVLEALGESVTSREQSSAASATDAVPPDVWLVLADQAALDLTHHLEPHASLVLETTLPTAEHPPRVSAYQRVRHACLYPSFDPAVRTLVEEAEVIDGARAVGLTFGAPGPSDVGLVENVVVDRAFHATRAVEAIELFALADLQEILAPAQLSTRDVLQAMAAAALARSVGASPEAVLAGLRTS
mgnify:FL=1